MEKIAIVGMGCRMPGGVSNPEEFWKLLSDGIDATKDVPKDRWDKDSFYHPDKSVPGKTYAFHGGFLDNIDKFDANFFGISPREASYLDPQQRILLESSWEAFEDAGIDPVALAGKDVGVYIGGFTLDHKVLQFSTDNRSLIDAHTATGSMMTMLSNRLSYIYNFHGPSMSVDTACSSSLVAIHLACQALRNKECSIALAGGVNVILTPEYTIAESKGGFLSPEGRCKAFDSRADGYARGEGVGVIVLKTLDKALEDKDDIYSVILSSSVNQDGHTNGITVPSGEAQMAVMRDAYRKAGISPGEINYFEAHGTGTPVGDPIEANAISNVLSEGRPKGEKCFVGSLKTNIGHLEAAAGIASIIKSCLVMKKRMIPPHLNFLNPNPQIPFEKLCIKLPLKTEELPTNNGNVYIGVNGFGFGGTNAHVVLSTPPKSSDESEPRNDNLNGMPYILPISARSEAALAGTARQYLESFSENLNRLKAQDICFSASQKRSHHGYRLAVAFRTKEELCQKLDNFLAEEKRPGIVQGKVMGKGAEKLAFVYTGMGPIWWAMGRQLLESNKVFRDTIERCDVLTKNIAGWSLIAEMTASEDNSRLDQPMYAQPANFALQVGLTKVWESLGIKPDVLVGHSVGEVAAVYASGALSLEDAMRVSLERSRWQQKTVGNGTMIAIGLSEEEAKNLITKYSNGVSVAAINSPKSVTLAGDEQVLETIRQHLDSEGIFARFLKVNVAYHSYQMDEIEEGLKESLKDIRPQKSSTPIYSTVTGTLMEGTEYDAGYWWKNVRNEVRFQTAINEIAGNGFRLFLEVGPHPVLSTAIKECMDGLNLDEKVFPSIKRKEDEQIAIMGTLGALYTIGYPVNWRHLYPDGRYEKLPHYDWQHERYWSETKESEDTRLGNNINKVLGRKLTSVHPSWELEMDVYKYPYLNDHKIQGSLVFPGAGYVELSLACAKEVFGETEYVVENIEFKKAIFLKNGNIPKVQTMFNPVDYSVEIFSKPLTGDSNWTNHASMKLSRRKSGFKPSTADIDEIMGRCGEPINRESCYKMFYNKGYQYGSLFQGIKRIWIGKEEVLTEIEAPVNLGDFQKEYTLHPALLDATFQSMVAMMLNYGDSSDVFLPVGIEKLVVYKKSEPFMWSHAYVIERNTKNIIVNMELYDRDGNTILEVLGLKAQSLSTEASEDYARLSQWIYGLNWIEAPKKEIVKESKSGYDESWLVLSDEGGFSKGIAKLAKSNNIKCIEVSPYDSKTFNGNAGLNIEDESYFEELFSQINKQGEIDKIIYLVPLNSDAEGAVNCRTLKKHSATGCLGLLNMLKAMKKCSVNAKVWIATKGAVTVQNICSEKGLLYSSVWGIARVFGHNEKAEYWGGIIDVDPVSNVSGIDMFYNEIINRELDDQIAFRSGKRYVARIDNLKTLPVNAPICFDKNGSYIVTGAFGALGMLVCKWMVENGARRLILMGRSILPDRIEWKNHDKDSSVGKRISLITELEAMGASIHIASIDLADMDQLNGYLEKYEKENWPQIKGVIHSAGVVNDKIIDNMDSDSFNMVLAPKVLGGWNLHEAFKDKELDFFILFSSIASTIVFSMGQSNYASGNAFLDSLANYRMSMGLPAISIGWGPWSEVGMAEQLNLIEYFKNRGAGAISPRAGMTILSSLFGNKASHAIVVDATWSLVAKAYPTDRAPLMVELLAEKEKLMKAKSKDDNSSNENDPMQELLAAEPENRQSVMEHHLKKLIAGVLRFDSAKLDIHQPLNIFGMDSMMATEIKYKVKTVFDATIPLVDLIQGNTVSQLSSKILETVKYK